ncbi:MAG: carboxypeptidase regulatory-like domain-containing protein [Planctomycetaceae bacterium]|nr:carboxypeptidase regulatory-like domain-containing protein [Planctomycetaceae bacterium]
MLQYMHVKFDISLLHPAFGLAVVMLVGCGKSGPPVVEKLVPAAVQIMMDGKPLANATVTLIPVPGQQDAVSASAVTGDDGYCEPVSAIPSVALHRSRGMVAGKYMVTVSKLSMPDGSTLPPETTDAEAMEKGARESIPIKYSHFEKTTLEADIRPNANNLTFDLKG